MTHSRVDCRGIKALGFVGLVSLALSVGCKKQEPAAPAPAAAPVAAKVTTPKAAYSRRVEVSVTQEGFVPARIPAKAGEQLTLVITRKTEQTCATEILFAGQVGDAGVKTDLPLNKAVEVVYTPKAGGLVKFGCAMGMMVGGVLEVE